MKILISAYACEPNKGSEPRLGWYWVKFLSQYNEIWVITRRNNKEVIEKELSKNPLPNVNFLYYDLPRWLSFWKKGRRGYHLYYYLWQIGIYLKFRKFILEEKFDIIHHVTFGNNWQPSFLSLLPVTFVWGPIGGEDIPFIILKQLHLKAKIKEFIRLIVRLVGQYLDPFVRLTAKKAAIILETSSKWARKPYPYSCRKKIIKFPQNGIDLNEVPFNPEEVWEEKEKQEEFTIVFIGEFVPWKGVLFVAESLVKFASQVKSNDWQAVIVGDGPEYRKVKKIIEEGQIKDKVKLTGKVSMEEVWNILKKAHIFVYPTFHHGQATVLMQAMISGVPVICLEGDAIAETVDNEAGFCVKLGEKEKIIQNICSAMIHLYRDKEVRTQLGKNAQKLVKELYLWDKKAAFVFEVYKKLSAKGK